MRVLSALKYTENRLKSAGIEEYKYEAEIIIEDALSLDRAAVIAHGEDEISDDKLTEIHRIADRRANGKPLQYALGRWRFMGLDLYVGEGVLIPRDDTEVVTGLCLGFLKNRESRRALDLCSGTGAIALALQKFANADVTGIEKSEKAFGYFQKNNAHYSNKVKAIKGDIFECHGDFEDNSFDLIVSNPPYIKSDEIPYLQKEVRFEPKDALDGGGDGLRFYRTIIKLWSKKLKQGGTLAFELGENQADYVKALMTEHGFENIKTALDLGGVQRAIIGTLKNNTKHQ